MAGYIHTEGSWTFIGHNPVNEEIQTHNYDVHGADSGGVGIGRGFKYVANAQDAQKNSRFP